VQDKQLISGSGGRTPLGQREIETWEAQDQVHAEGPEADRVRLRLGQPEQPAARSHLDTDKIGGGTAHGVALRIL
jgi:hypothetical protein